MHLNCFVSYVSIRLLTPSNDFHAPECSEASFVSYAEMLLMGESNLSCPT
jgi:hypothetical protein